MCSYCKKSIITPECHHAFLSRRYSLKDLRNMAPVHSAGEDPKCHEEAHTRAGGDIIRLALLDVLGDGDIELGRQIVNEAGRQWTPKTWHDI